MPRESWVWSHFVRNEADKNESQCNECGQNVKCKSGSTTGLMRHLASKHKLFKPSEEKGSGRQVTGSSRDAPEPQGSGSKKRSRSGEADEASEISEDIARMMAVDGISANQIARSRFIRDSFSRKGVNPPHSHTTVMNLMYEHYEFVVKEIKYEIGEQLSQGLRFSVTLDEYTSIANRRYLNVNVHSVNKHWNLGMLQIKGSMTSERLLTSLRNKLDEFGLDLKTHIVCVITDVASVMVKFGKLLPCEHQLCFAHTLHLAVCDVLYSQKGIQFDIVVNEDAGSTQYSDGEEEDNVDAESGFLFQNEDGNDDLSLNDIVIPSDHDDNSSKININATLAKVRKIIKNFRLSPLKTETLEKYTSDEP